MDPNSRKTRIEELFNTNEVSKSDVAKHLGISLTWLTRRWLSKPVINSLELIRAIHEVSGGKIPLHWIITGEGPRKIGYRIKGKVTTTIQQRIKGLLLENEIKLTDYSKAVGRDRKNVYLSLNVAEEDLQLFHIIAVHLLTGASFDFIISGLEPVYISRRAEKFSLVDFIALTP